MPTAAQGLIKDGSNTNHFLRGEAYGFEFSADFVADNWNGCILGADWTTALVQNDQHITKWRIKHITVGEKIIPF